jgi:mono/diheme cytochrome c family protein
MRMSCAVLWAALAAAAQAAPPDPGAERLFATQVLPLLKDKCFACHGGDKAKVKGGLDLTTRDGLLRGGDGGPAVAPGKPADSTLVSSVVRSDSDTAMPPKENDKLTPEQVEAVRRWVEAGAPWPSAEKIAELKADKWAATGGVRVKTTGGLSADWTDRTYKPDDLWAYRPVAKPTRPAGGHPIDAFLNAKLMVAGLAPAPPADRRVLLRRLTFDLTGLPPTPRETDEFLANESPDAYEKLVERLLASPHYGERMAQRWLDVARYADSAGFANDFERGTAWRYRDYVVRAFNADKPYDRFVREQLAGDEIDPANPEMLVATGFLRMGPWELTGMEVAKVARQRFLDDVTDTVGQVFLAHPLQCCRCHDHKFDPVPTRDYYSIQAAFATTQPADRAAPFLPAENRDGFDREEKYAAVRKAWLTDELARVVKLLYPAKADGTTPKRGKKDGDAADPADLGIERYARKGLERLKWAADRTEPFALSVYAGRTPELKAVLAPFRMPADRMTAGELEATAVLAGGDPFGATVPVTPGVLSAANGGSAGDVPAAVEGRRKAFAEWVASPANPLTARVMVNRVWGWHFGTPLAGNPNNFGTTGKKPTHPELLDWLAASFVEEGWSVKALTRKIVTSAAYRRSARHPDPKAVAATDPAGSLLVAFRPRRLTAEELRDAMLAATGELNRAVGGIPCRPELPPEIAFQPRMVMGTFAEPWRADPLPSQRHRRSLYGLKLRGLRDPFFEVFNRPDPDAPCEMRDSSTVAPQAFALFNGRFAQNRALALAATAAKTSPADPLAEAFRRAVGRPPTAVEANACRAHWRAMTDRHRTNPPPAEPAPLKTLSRTAVEENTGEKFTITEPLEAAADFVPDLRPADVTPEVRGLADVCLVLFNSNEFAYLE